jgi:hypothetical protein
MEGAWRWWTASNGMGAGMAGGESQSIAPLPDVCPIEENSTHNGEMPRSYHERSQTEVITRCKITDADLAALYTWKGTAGTGC